MCFRRVNKTSVDMDDRSNSQTGLLNELLANNSRYAKTFEQPMSLGVKRKVGCFFRPKLESINSAAGTP